MKAHGLYIDGKWCSGKGNGTFESRNPATGELLGFFTMGTAADVETAVSAAAKAFPLWRRVPAPKRGEILLAAASLLKQRKEELGRLVSMEMGKVLAEGKGDVQEAVDFLEYISGEGRRLFGRTTPSELPDKFCLTFRQPVGVVGCITPWNFPFAVPSWKLGAALIAGNCVVFKPASLTPLCAVRLVEIFEEAGLPPGVLNLVTGSPDRVGPGLIDHPAIRVLSFTGSVEAGRKIYAQASQSMKRVALELGGKNPMIVLDDADLDLALEGVLFGAFGTAGQRCTATSRLIVQDGIYDRFLEALLAKVSGLRIGDPLDPAVDMGPVCGREQESKILGYVELGKGEGARLFCGGKKLTDPPLRERILHRSHGLRGHPRDANHQRGDLRARSLRHAGEGLPGSHRGGQ